jgi:hypothetical protein
VDVDRLRTLAWSLPDSAAGLDGMLDELVSHGELLGGEHRATAEPAAVDLVGAAPVICG